MGMPRWLVAERPDIMFDVKNVSENLQSPKFDTGNKSVNSDVIANKSVN